MATMATTTPMTIQASRDIGSPDWSAAQMRNTRGAPI
jgi:hypothetical protein